MKAIAFDTPGDPEVLTVREWPEPVIQQDTELLVRLKAAGVNPLDTKLRRRGTFYPERMPAILGCDGAGVVEAVGEEVQNFQVGDAVYFCHGGIGNHPGNYAELATVDERFAAHKPASLSFAEAAAAPLVLITAWEALYERGQLHSAQQVLIHGGAGGVGHVAVQIAKLRGARVCTTVSSPTKADFVQSLGAEVAILYQQADFVQAALAWSNGNGVDLALDTVGGATLSQTFKAVRLYGDVVTILEPTAETDWKTARVRNLRLGNELMLTPMLENQVQAQQHQANILYQCARLIDAGQLRIHVSKQFALEEAAAAHRFLEAGSVMGKIVLRI
ncbi:MAG TPA: zinc-dependent alcohol dehydrogenase family protein [Candidatus Caenarcaniphilales bacterium]